MMTKEQAKSAIQELVKNFSEREDYYKSAAYNETEARNDFINPLFTALGWDITSSDVKLEDNVEVEGENKRPDYGFYCLNANNKLERKFFVEAKKPNVNLTNNLSVVQQIRSYAWSAHLPVSILTDFEEFAVYDCNHRVKPTDEVRTCRLKYINYKNYIKEFDYLWDNFSKQAVINGSIEKYASELQAKRGAESVDDALLKSLDEWRIELTREIHTSNPNLTTEQIAFAQQKIMDRLMFLRIAEDRQAEPFEMLANATNESNVYDALKDIFSRANEKYNTGLFDPNNDPITDKITIRDFALKNIIPKMYYPVCPYKFAVMPVEVMGHSYEKYLGTEIVFGENNSITIQQKADVQKAGGVYYTPQYIVDYILKNTLGKVLEGKTPEEVENIKICDPACGSGSFLIGAYDYLLHWHKDYYKQNPPQENAHHIINEAGELTIEKKKDILIKNIFGVDLDENAVEIAKLSLLLKAMEGENDVSINAYRAMNRNAQVLPSLGKNIKFGNSLKPTEFNWQVEFPSIFAQGGFDIIIGNPPYGAEISAEDQAYYNRLYGINNNNTAALFMVFVQSILKVNGFHGFIVPKAFTYVSTWAAVRNQLLPHLVKVVDCGKVWKNVNLEMTTYTLQKGIDTPYFESYVLDLKTREFNKVGNFDKELCNIFGFILNGVSTEELNIGHKLYNMPNRLNDFITNARGSHYQQLASETMENGNALKVLGGRNIHKFEEITDVYGYIAPEIVVHNNARVAENSVLIQNIITFSAKPIPRVSLFATVIDSNRDEYVLLDTINQLTVNDNMSKYTVAALINSKLLCWYILRFIFGNAKMTMHFDNPVTSRIPFPSSISSKKQKEIEEKVKTIMEDKRKLQNTKNLLPNDITRIQRDICNKEAEIDAIVYELFNLTKEEIQLINNSYV